MNYIQRLFDASGPLTGQSGVNTVTHLSSSPIVAADQRISLFPSLFDTPEIGAQSAFELPPSQTDSLERRPATDHRTKTASASPARKPHRSKTNEPNIQADGISSLETPSKKHHSQAPNPYTEHKNPLQRLVELDPIPAGRDESKSDNGLNFKSKPNQSSEQMATPMASFEIPASPPTSETTVLAQPGNNQAATERARDSFSNPFAITPEQFQVEAGSNNDVSSLKPIADSSSEQVAPVVSHSDQSAIQAELEPVTHNPAEAPEYLQPSPDPAQSPFANHAAIPPAPTYHQSAPPADIVQERIIERIREIPVAPKPPPQAMTAAAQSVIGPLSHRSLGAWRPRQGEF